MGSKEDQNPSPDQISSSPSIIAASISPSPLPFKPHHTKLERHSYRFPLSSDQEYPIAEELELIPATTQPSQQLPPDALIIAFPL